MKGGQIDRPPPSPTHTHTPTERKNCPQKVQPY